jgi:hypothetical protein
MAQKPEAAAPSAPAKRPFSMVVHINVHVTPKAQSPAQLARYLRSLRDAIQKNFDLPAEATVVETPANGATEASS